MGCALKFLQPYTSISRHCLYLANSHLPTSSNKSSLMLHAPIVSSSTSAHLTLHRDSLHICLLFPPVHGLHKDRGYVLVILHSHISRVEHIASSFVE